MPRWADVQKTMRESLRHGETLELMLLVMLMVVLTIMLVLAPLDV